MSPQVEDDPAFIAAWGVQQESNAYWTVKQLRREYGRWDNARICRLARLANCTLQELFAAVCGTTTRRNIASHWVKNSWPLFLVIHLAKFESYLLQRKFAYVRKAEPDERAQARLMLGIDFEDD